VLNLSKSNLKPHQAGNWLGFTIDLALGCFLVPDENIERLKDSAFGITHPSRVPIRAVAAVVGQIMSMSLALGPIARLRTRALYTVINSYFSWNAWVTLTEDAKEELCFWQSNVAALNGQPIWFKSGATRVVYSDASDSGYGGYSVEVGQQFVQGSWSEHEAHLSSTWRELKAVYQVLYSLAPKLKGHIVKWFTDNQNVTRIVQSGSKKPHLQDGAMAIYEACFQNGIKLEMEWIPRSQNELADYVSIAMFTQSLKVNCEACGAWGLHAVHGIM
jgi:hypothetical protein